MTITREPEQRRPRVCLTLETPAASPEAAHSHFMSKMAFETDPADVHSALQKGADDFVLVDTRSPHAFAEEHIPGANNLPIQRVNAETAQALFRDRPIVAYCYGPGCNGSTKGAARLAELGFRIKEMIGGSSTGNGKGTL